MIESLLSSVLQLSYSIYIKGIKALGIYLKSNEKIFPSLPLNSLLPNYFILNKLKFRFFNIFDNFLSICFDFDES